MLLLFLFFLSWLRISLQLFQGDRQSLFPWGWQCITCLGYRELFIRIKLSFQFSLKPKIYPVVAEYFYFWFIHSWFSVLLRNLISAACILNGSSTWQLCIHMEEYILSWFCKAGWWCLFELNFLNLYVLSIFLFML